jgi:flagella basal body P-ring formation protein FlgA
MIVPSMKTRHRIAGKPHRPKPALAQTAPDSGEPTADAPVARATDPRFSFNPEQPRRSGYLRRRSFASAMSLLAIAFSMVAARLSARTLEVAAEVEVDSSGVLLGALVPSLASEPSGGLKVADSPEFGRMITVERTAIEALLREQAPGITVTNWTGAGSVKVQRKSRPLGEDEIRGWLTDALQREQVRDRGELELRITGQWKPVAVPDEPLKFRVVDLPLNGIGSSFIARVAVDCGETRIGTWPVMVQAKIWRDVLVAGSTLVKGQPLVGADVRSERRDLLLTRDYITPEALEKGSLEFVTSVSRGQLVTGRALRVRPAVTRGTIVDGLVADGAMTISIKVEVLEDGVVGQNLRVRNLKTRREMLGKVQNEQTIVLYL